MVVGKIVTKLIQTLPSWEVTKYYGRVCIFQLRCLKYRIQTSEAWFNFKCKFMPNSLRDELECEESVQEERKPATKSKKKERGQTLRKARDLKIDAMEEEPDDSRSSSQDNLNQFYNDENLDFKTSKMLKDKEQNEYYIKDFREDNRKQKSAKTQKKARQESQ